MPDTDPAPGSAMNEYGHLLVSFQIRDKVIYPAFEACSQIRARHDESLARLRDVFQISDSVSSITSIPKTAMPKVWLQPDDPVVRNVRADFQTQYNSLSENLHRYVAGIASMARRVFFKNYPDETLVIASEPHQSPESFFDYADNRYSHARKLLLLPDEKVLKPGQKFITGETALSMLEKSPTDRQLVKDLIDHQRHFQNAVVLDRVGYRDAAIEAAAGLHSMSKKMDAAAENLLNFFCERDSQFGGVTERREKNTVRGPMPWDRIDTTNPMAFIAANRDSITY